MVMNHESHAITESTTIPRADGVATEPLVTLFGVPKPFLGHEGVIQRNALKSWVMLGDQVEVILFGGEVGTAEYSSELRVRHIPELPCNPQGTPLLDFVFSEANRHARGQILLYANCDIIFLDDLVDAITIADRSELDSFLLIGRRTDIEQREMMDFENANWQDLIRDKLTAEGELAPVVCKDYFGFRKGQFDTIPPFAVGRGNWDNWMVHHAIDTGIPVADCTQSVRAIHQNHGYSHLQDGRVEAYVKGEEAEQNRRLAGGRHLVSGCAADWRLTLDGMERWRRPRSSAFFRDLPRFASLMSELFVRKR